MGSSGKKGHPLCVTSSIYGFCIWIFLVFTVFVFSTIKNLIMPNLNNLKCCNFTAKNFSYQLLILAKRWKTSEVLTLNSLSFIPRSSGVAVGKSTILAIIVWDFLMFYQTFLSPQVKRIVIISNKHGIYELPNELPDDLRMCRI